MMRIEAGEIVLLRGQNGSGKTTMLRALAGLETPWLDDGAAGRGPGAEGRGSGRGQGVVVGPGPGPGPSLGPWPAALGPCPASELAKRVSLATQDARDALAGLTVEGELRLRAMRVPADLARLEARESATLSSGEARRVCLALADRGVPLLLLDEPAEGLDDDGRARARALVERHAAGGGSVVAADHAGLFDDLATRVIEVGERDDGAPLQSVPRGRDGPPVVGAWGPGFHALVGPNGSGKTTLLRKLAAPGRRARLAATHPVFMRATVREECGGAGPLVPEALLDRHPLTLSGGEAQRVSLARAFSRPAPAYLLDEPEAHLDAAGKRALVAEIAARVEAGACVVAATHDARLVALARSVVSL